MDGRNIKLKKCIDATGEIKRCAGENNNEPLVCERSSTREKRDGDRGVMEERDQSSQSRLKLSKTARCRCLA